MLTREQDGPLTCSFCGRDMFDGLSRVAWQDLNDLRIDHGGWSGCPRSLAAAKAEVDASLRKSGYDVEAMDRAFAKGNYGPDPSYFMSENVQARARRRARVLCLVVLAVVVLVIWALAS